MKVTFFANFLNHIQFHLAQEFISNGCDFHFVATQKLPEVYQKLGHEDLNEKYDFVVRRYESDEQEEKAKKLAIDSDVVIIGQGNNDMLNLRMQQDKLTFIYSERVLKKGTYRRFIPRTHRKIVERFSRYNGKNLKVLCASAYLPLDLSLTGFKNDLYKWGYFPQTKSYDIDQLMNGKDNDVPTIVCAGRLTKIKRIKDIITLAKKLKENRYEFKVQIIGNGECEKELKAQAEKMDVCDKVFFLGSMSPEKVREYMEKANIFVFSSNFYEGWGTVMNEAMNSGCAVVASHAIGSVPYLVEHGETGMVYKMGNIKSMYDCVSKLLDDPELTQKLGRQAYEILIEKWNPKVAVKRLLELSKNLLKGDKYNFDSGVCSKAPIVKQNFKR